ncbi:hypothetical protein [Kozakia baliensis]|uniref:Uncharacterized protein n=1 Tax=Kozakia baliensis TaxID=153496 RepID=A0A1D8UTH7_9PROT|nr:hypothetical protein [Kozakia baliensis]AOX16951.1 hypothetical protein A0U89_07135 [Kozakia baliensis]GBR25488.1 hypothetical protein AA0488_0659 [Kozakia baliensis NRIC 0488]GEL64001.1 hypothetical protein KBA01_12870 [Kozakia baliensis]
MTNTTKQPSTVRSRDEQVEALHYTIQMGTAYAWQEARLKAEKHILEAEQRARMEKKLPAFEKDEGANFVLEELCERLGVEEGAVAWDAATETWEGDVSAVLGNILEEAFGEDADPAAVCKASRDTKSDARAESTRGGKAVYQYRATNSYWMDTSSAFFNGRKNNGQECRVLYTAPQPNAQAEKVARLEAENARFRKLVNDARKWHERERIAFSMKPPGDYRDFYMQQHADMAEALAFDQKESGE